MYGQAFVSMWANTDLAEVKSLWAEKLGGFTAEQFGVALKILEEKPYPPNLPEFLSLCRQAARNHPAPGQYREPDPIKPAEAAKVMANIESRIGLKKADKTDYQGWARRIIERKEAGEIIPHVALNMAMEVAQCKTKP